MVKGAMSKKRYKELVKEQEQNGKVLKKFNRDDKVLFDPERLELASCLTYAAASDLSNPTPDFKLSKKNVESISVLVKKRYQPIDLHSVNIPIDQIKVFRVIGRDTKGRRVTLFYYGRK